jgi:hypothetical protein
MPPYLPASEGYRHLRRQTTIKITTSPHPDTPVSTQLIHEWPIQDNFPGKPGHFSPVRNPLYFSSIAGLRARTGSRMACRQPVFRDRCRAAKLAGFFLFKTPCFKNHLIKTKIVERIGTISTGTSRTRIRPGYSPSEK